MDAVVMAPADKTITALVTPEWTLLCQRGRNLIALPELALSAMHGLDM